MRRVTRQRLEYLLKNWGAWERSARLGPSAKTVCASAEGRYASDQERYVWEGQAHVPRETPDDPILAAKTEDVLVRVPMELRQMIVLRYAREFSVMLMAARLGIGTHQAEAGLDTALAMIWRELEEESWASGL